MAAPYEDAPLMIITGLIGVFFLFLGLRAAIAPRDLRAFLRVTWRERTHRSRERREFASRR